MLVGWFTQSLAVSAFVEGLLTQQLQGRCPQGLRDIDPFRDILYCRRLLTAVVVTATIAGRLSEKTKMGQRKIPVPSWIQCTIAAAAARGLAIVAIIAIARIAVDR